ncbi:MAG: Rpp14/Pop5 family protein [Archaeoglobaceae archaeon]|nr:ribonuclease P [Archaeoglobaceae archaeon]MDW7990112.1 Rpp14/Pop5 family protein [Archaeoglobaceae archaeon]
MKLPSSMRVRKRYIAFRVIAEKNIEKEVLWETMMKSFISLFGETETMNSAMRLEEFENNRGIVSCKLESLEKVMISLTLIDCVGGVDVALVTLGVSGTIKKCKRKMEVV